MFTIRHSPRSLQKRDNVDHLLFSSIKANDFIPTYFINNHMIINNNLYYYIISFNYTTIKSTKIINTINSYGMNIYTIAYPKKDIIYYITQGLIYVIEHGVFKILFVSGYDIKNESQIREHYYTRDRETRNLLHSITDGQKRIYIDVDCLTNAKYSNIYYFIKNKLLNSYYVRGATVELVFDVNKTCFNSTQIGINRNTFENTLFDIHDNMGLKRYIALQPNELPESIPDEVPEMITIDEPLSEHVTEIALTDTVIADLVPPLPELVVINNDEHITPMTPPTPEEFADAEEEIGIAFNISTPLIGEISNNSINIDTISEEAVIVEEIDDFLNSLHTTNADLDIEPVAADFEPISYGFANDENLILNY